MYYTPDLFPGTHTMLTDTHIKNRREEILEEIRAIRHIKRGTISTQVLRRPASDGTIKERGPYHLFQCWDEGKNRSQRIPSARLPELQQAVDGYQQLKKLTDEFAALTEILTERSGPLLPAKKNSKSQPTKRSSKKRKPSSNSPAGD
jgi:hypothetical protein